MEASDIIANSRSLSDDIDKLRCEWESRTHWLVRKSFLLRNWDDFKDKDRLICLSQAWFNSRFHGNSYPYQVMETIQNMEDGMEPMEVMLKKAEMQVIGFSDTQPKRMKNVHDTSRLPRTFYAMRFVRQKDDCDTDCSDLKTDIPDPPIKLDNNDQSNDDVVEGSRPNPNKIPSNDAERFHGNELQANNKSTVGAKEENITPNVTEDLPKQRPLSFFNVRQTKINLSKHNLEQLKSLVLSVKENQTAISIIHQSADFSKLTKEFVFEDDAIDLKAPSHTCSVHLNGVLVARCTASDKKTAKYAAAESALELLKKTQPTIFIAANPGDLESAISRDEISRTKKNYDEISDTNIGNQLLRKMGWTGKGGLGKLGTGIATPVDVKESCYRAGLGTEIEDSNLVSFSDAHVVIRNFASSNSLEELTFSPELSNQERAIIHRLSKRYGLKSRSYNHGDVRYLVVSRKLSAMEMVRQLELSGGAKGNVRLIAPSCDMNSSPTSSNANML